MGCGKFEFELKCGNHNYCSAVSLLLLLLLLLASLRRARRVETWKGTPNTPGGAAIAARTPPPSP